MNNRRLAVLIPLLALVGCGEMGAVIADANSRRASADERQVIEAVLDHEASLPRDGRPVCVARRTERATFDSDRDSIRRLREERPRNPRDAEFAREALAAHQASTYEWRRPDSLENRSYGEVPLLERAETERLDVAARRLVNGAAHEDEPVEIDPELVPRTLRRFWRMFSCGTLTLAAPAFSNGIAFVETSHECGGFCGNGWLYALERREGRWQLAAMAFTWVS